MPTIQNAIQNVSQVSERVSDSIGKVVKDHLAQKNMTTPRTQESKYKPRPSTDPLLGEGVVNKKEKHAVLKNEDNEDLNESLMDGINVDEIVREDFADIKPDNINWYSNVPAANFYEDSVNSRRSSAAGGMDLMMSSQKKDPADPNFFSPNAVSQSLDNNNAVGDRILDIADFLVRDNSNFMDVPEDEVRKNAARRLRILADCIAGLISIAEYDSKFSDMTINVTKSEAASVIAKTASQTPKKAGSLYDISVPQSGTKSRSNNDPLKILLS